MFIIISEEPSDTLTVGGGQIINFKTYLGANVLKVEIHFQLLCPHKFFSGHVWAPENIYPLMPEAWLGIYVQAERISVVQLDLLCPGAF